MALILLLTTIKLKYFVGLVWNRYFVEQLGKKVLSFDEFDITGRTRRSQTIYSEQLFRARFVIVQIIIVIIIMTDTLLA